MKMQDIMEAGKFKNPFKGADAASDAAKAEKGADAASDAGNASKAGKSSLDDLKYVRDRIFGKKEPKVDAGSPNRVEPNLDDVPTPKVDAPTDTPKKKPSAKKTEPAAKKTEPKADDELDDIRKNAGVPKKAAEPETAPAPKAEEPPVATKTDEPDFGTPRDEPEFGGAFKSADELEADYQAQMQAIRQQELADARRAADEAAHQKEIEKINAEKRAHEQEVDALRNQNAPPPEPTTGDKVKGDLKDIAGTAWDVAKKPLGYGAGVGLANYGIDVATGINPIGTVKAAIKDKNERDAASAAKPLNQQIPPNLQNNPQTPPEKKTYNELPDPDAKESMAYESMSAILKLSGLKPITERDVTSGLTKAKPIMTLVESANLSECGGMGMSTPTNATLNISASASTGEEVAGMLASILQLAGLKQVDASMMPQSEPMPMMKAMDIMTANPDSMMGAEEPTVIDVEMDNPETPQDETDIDVVAGEPDLINGQDDEEEKTDEGFEDATTTPNPTAMPGYGSWEQKFQRLSSEDMGYVPPGSGNNPLKKAKAVEESVAEVDTVTHGLFKAYEAFKNGQ